MTDARLSGFKDGLCAVPDCFNRRHVSRSGRQYAKCTEHFKQSYARKNAPKAPRPTVKPSQVGRTVQIVVADWTQEKLLFITAVVSCEEAMPSTFGALRTRLAQAAQDGAFVAQSHAYKEEDLKPEGERLEHS